MNQKDCIEIGAAATRAGAAARDVGDALAQAETTRPRMQPRPPRGYKAIKKYIRTVVAERKKGDAIIEKLKRKHAGSIDPEGR